jgi:hypothetical protein
MGCAYGAKLEFGGIAPKPPTAYGGKYKKVSRKGGGEAALPPHRPAVTRKWLFYRLTGIDKRKKI